MSLPVDPAAIRQHAVEQEQEIFDEVVACGAEHKTPEYKKRLADVYKKMAKAIAGSKPAAAVDGGGAVRAQDPALAAEHEAYWEKLGKMRHQGVLALQYVKTLRKTIAATEDKIRAATDAEERLKLLDKKKYFDVVQKYCFMFAKACSDTRESYSVVPNLSMLNDIERLLVRAALPTPACGAQQRVMVR
jgi:hypothetical protein